VVADFRKRRAVDFQPQNGGRPPHSICPALTCRLQDVEDFFVALNGGSGKRGQFRARPKRAFAAHSKPRSRGGSAGRFQDFSKGCGIQFLHLVVEAATLFELLSGRCQ